MVENSVTKSGIIISVGGDKHMEYAEVIAKDKDIKGIKVGDTVYFKMYSLNALEVDGEKYSFIKEEDVLGIAWPTTMTMSR